MGRGEHGSSAFGGQQLRAYGAPPPTVSHVLTLNTGGYYSAKKGNKRILFFFLKNLLCAAGLQKVHSKGQLFRGEQEGMRDKCAPPRVRVSTLCIFTEKQPLTAPQGRAAPAPTTRRTPSFPCTARVVLGDRCASAGSPAGSPSPAGRPAGPAACASPACSLSPDFVYRNGERSHSHI